MMLFLDMYRTASRFSGLLKIDYQLAVSFITFISSCPIFFFFELITPEGGLTFYRGILLYNVESPK